MEPQILDKNALDNVQLSRGSTITSSNRTSSTYQTVESPMSYLLLNQHEEPELSKSYSILRFINDENEQSEEHVSVLEQLKELPLEKFGSARSEHDLPLQNTHSLVGVNATTPVKFDHYLDMETSKAALDMENSAEAKLDFEKQINEEHCQ